MFPNPWWVVFHTRKGKLHTPWKVKLIRNMKLELGFDSNVSMSTVLSVSEATRGEISCWTYSSWIVHFRRLWVRWVDRYLSNACVTSFMRLSSFDVRVWVFITLMLKLNVFSFPPQLYFRSSRVLGWDNLSLKKFWIRKDYFIEWALTCICEEIRSAENIELYWILSNV